MDIVAKGWLQKMNTSPSPENDDERPSEASSQASEKEESVGFRQVFPKNAFESHYKGQNTAKPYTPYTTSTIEKSVETSPEANGEQKNTGEKPYTNPTRSTPLPEGWEEFVL